MTLVSPALVFAQDGEDIARQVDQADRGWGDEQLVATMTLRARDGREATLSFRTITMETGDDGDKSLVIFDEPADVRGTVFLTHAHKTGEDDQWLYLPALSRVKRISSSNRSGPFMGSKFAFEDVLIRGDRTLHLRLCGRGALRRGLDLSRLRTLPR